MKTAIACGVMLAALWQPLRAQTAATPPACNRTCLEGYIDRYLAAMQAHTVSDDLFARDTKLTENGVRLPLGKEGLWFRMSGQGTYKFYVPDVETQQVAFFGTVREKERNESLPVALVLRLKIVDAHITEVEQLVIRPEGGLTNNGTQAPRPVSTAERVEKLGAPHPVFGEVIPEGRRPSREELIRTANYYFSGLQRNDGKGYYPFTDDCDRFENGNHATNVPMRNPDTGQTEVMGCKKQFEVALKNVVSRVRDRRFVAVDRERGIVFAFAFFDHEQINWTWQLGELFKIQDGKIRRIEAIFQRAPYGINSGWSTYEQGRSDQPQAIR
ncbi:MAG: hypothetical protein WDM77_03525 [Steroidobacteraceae bacterium]